MDTRQGKFCKALRRVHVELGRRFRNGGIGGEEKKDSRDYDGFHRLILYPTMQTHGEIR